MGVGIEIYKSDGRLSVSSSDWSTRLLGSRNTGASNGSITINKNANQLLDKNKKEAEETYEYYKSLESSVEE